MKISFELAAEARDDEGKGASRRLRHAGRVPAILYGDSTKLEQILNNLLFTGRTFGAREAFELGLASRIAEPGTALATAHALAGVLAAKPARVMRMAREAFVRECDADYRRGVAAAVENFCNVAATPESKAGIRAFVERPRRGGDRGPR